jgi:signal peptidase II
VLAVTVAALALVLAWFAFDPGRPGLWLAVGLLAGGALGNLADRVRVDAVTDFIDPPLWPAFNVADIAITAGALGLAVASIGLSEQGHRSSA